jgi:exosortase
MLLLAGLLGWLYGSTIAPIAQRWSDTPEYSHGWLVPAFALWVAWSDAGRRSLWPLRGLTMAGLALFAGGMAVIVWSPASDQAQLLATVGAVAAACGAVLGLPDAGQPTLRTTRTPGGWLLLGTGGAALVAGGFLYIDWLAAAAIIPMLWGLAWIWWDRECRSSVWWAIPFLVFMIPLPYSVETAMREPLRQVATKLSTYVLQTVGFACLAEGYVIVIGESQVGVTEACSGLSMLMVFAALTLGCVMILQRPWWYRALICLSFPVIAVLSNVFRIVTTGGLLALGFEKLADITFHDLAGLAMMPVGLLLLWAEMWYLDHLVEVDREERLGSLLSAVPERRQPAAV